MTLRVFSRVNLISSSSLRPLMEKDSSLLDKPIWKSKTFPKVKSFVWTVVINKINTNDVLQKCRLFIAVSPSMCLLYCASSETRTIFFYIALLRILFGISFLGCLARIGPALRICNSFSLLNLGVFAFVKKLRLCYNVLFFAVLW